MGETENQIKPNQKMAKKPWRLVSEMAMFFVVGFLVACSFNGSSSINKYLFGKEGSILTNIMGQNEDKQDQPTKTISQNLGDFKDEKIPTGGNGNTYNFYKDSNNNSNNTYNTYNNTYASDLADLDCEGCVDHKDLALDSVLNNNIAFHAVDTRQLDSNSVTSRVLANNSIDSEHLDHHLTIKELDIANNLKVNKYIDLDGYQTVQGYFKVAQDTNPENFTLSSNSPDAYIEGKFEVKEDSYFKSSITVKNANSSTTITPTSITTSSFNADDIALTTANITAANVTTLNGNTITTGSGTLTLGSSSLAVSSDSSINQDVTNNASPTFAGLTLTGNLVLGANTLTTSNNSLVSNLNADLLDGHDSSYFQTALTNPITGTGTTNYIAKFNGTNALQDSVIYDDGTNVGIGTTDPNSLLEVGGDIRITGGSGGQIIFADGSTMSSAGAGSAESISSTTDAIITGDSDANASGGILLKTGSNTRIAVLNGGNIGIGTTAPGSYKLNVGGNTYIAGNLHSLGHS